MNRGEYISNIALFSYAGYIMTQTSISLVIYLYLYATIFNTLLKYAIHRVLPGVSWTCRPHQSCTSIKHPQEIGMPSGHAQTVFTLIGYLTPSDWWHYVVGFIVMYGRIDAQRHTPLQVVVGAIIGYLNGKLLRKSTRFHQLVNYRFMN